MVSGTHSVRDLPRLFRVEGARLICGGCRRVWRAPLDDRLNQLNFEYLCEHAFDHIYRNRLYKQGRANKRKAWLPTEV